MKYKYSKIFGQDVAIIQPDVFYDFRGEYIETWNIESYKDIPNEKFQEVVDYITMQVTSDEADYRQKQAELVKELKEKK